MYAGNYIYYEEMRERVIFLQIQPHYIVTLLSSLPICAPKGTRRHHLRTL